MLLLLLYPKLVIKLLGYNLGCYTDPSPFFSSSSDGDSRRMGRWGVGSNGGNLGFETGGFRVEDAAGSRGFFSVEEKGRWEVGNWVGFVVWAGLG